MRRGFSRAGQFGGGVAAAVSAFILAIPGQAQSVRDPYFWPFASDSIWNTPIGSGAAYHAISLPQMGQNRTDWEYLSETLSTDPTYNCDSFGYSLSLSMLANDPVINSNDDEYTNGVVAIVQPGGNDIYQVQAASRAAGGDISGVAIGWSYFNSWAETTLTGEGYYGAHTGSGLSVMGGSIRAWELAQSNNEYAIQHAIKIELDQNLLYLNPTTASKSYVWPAIQCDSSTAGYGVYKDDPALAMGSLLAIPASVTESSLGLQTMVGKQLFHALQDYGAYVADTSGVDYTFPNDNYIASFTEERDARDVFNMDCNENDGSAFYSDLNTLYQNLYAVTNNTSTSIGGGGTPRRSAAPSSFTPLANGTYTMTPSCATESRLDAYGWGTSNGSNVEIWSATGGTNQSWVFTNVGSDIYTIQPSYDTSLCLDVIGSGGSGTNCDLYTANGTPAQQWMVFPNADGTYTLSPRCAPSCALDVYQSGTANDTQVDVYTQNSTGAQRWTLASPTSVPAAPTGLTATAQS